MQDHQCHCGNRLVQSRSLFSFEVTVGALFSRARMIGKLRVSLLPSWRSKMSRHISGVTATFASLFFNEETVPPSSPAEISIKVFVGLPLALATWPTKLHRF